jgi:hypothetical protein
MVLARYARNNRLTDALFQQAFAALTGSPGARAFYDSLRARDIGTMTLCGACPTVSSGSCTAACATTPPTTKPPPGPPNTINTKPLDSDRQGPQAGIPSRRRLIP